ncbi:Regulator of protease activity HflC, stomatin/prohibitin superfamily [Pseudomonas delhiensis]|uniref:Regulator of protease activity HflC, stomatin/prohibitin superfamily n=1 Tax=Pseudomonas delhiensis TaxID=366289 RepID=A0A239JHG9_9PSED|nr:protease modulator HflK [Pseudomonas delhiensis]SDH93488.1 Regulator of protease activity HflC, stomatin/prohibitin superfamily [Pseudomonas delhiensis]SNT05032.1 Regulator of protease activity HflC, stomatin/prohibitin superfamily [Pseudomonas delhiensis]
MRVDLDTAGEDLQALPRFQQAAVHARRLFALALGSAVLAGLLFLLAILIGLFAARSPWLPLLCNNAAALLLLAAAAQSAWRVDAWRARALGQEPGLRWFGGREAAQEALPPEALSAYDRFLDSIGRGIRGLLLRVGPGALWLAGLAVAALLVVRAGWNLALPGADLGQAAYVGAGLLLLGAFGLLVLERHLAASTAAQWPEAAALAPLLRLVIAVQLLSLPGLLFASADNLWPVRLLVLLGLLPAAVAVELLARAVFSAFLPQRGREEPRLVARSLVAGQLHWPPRPLQFLQDELQQRFGIDLRQVWAFAFMRRAFLPVAALVALVGWLLSGIHEVPLDGRGVYERFGKPEAVLQPGLHAGLPWPFGRVIAVENGVIHELATSGDSATADPPGPAEGPAPDSANRLWDASHRSEKSQVIASAADGKQSFQVVNMDVRFVYRIGLSDAAALAATYNSADVPALIRSTASRVLVHDFASRTLDSVLGGQREALAQDIGKAVQADLDDLHSGVEILATVVEAIHPPAGAANAYHGVQAAQITAQALISRERGKAAEQGNEARLAASQAVDKANADARETLAAARAADLRFGAERKAWQDAGQSFLLERYFARLGQGLGSASALVIDHRLGAGDAPTLDLRGFLAAPFDPARKPAKQELAP